MIQSIVRAMKLLEELDNAGQDGLGLLEIGALAGLKGPTTHNLLQTLVILGYARQDSRTRRYFLGVKAYALGRRGHLPGMIARVAASPVRELHRQVNETIVLAMHQEGRRHTLFTVESSQPLRVGAGSGVDSHLYQTATGRVLLSRLSPDQLHDHVAANGLPGSLWPEIEAEDQLMEALAQFRDAGLARKRTPDGHVRALAVPVPLPELDANVALGLHYPTARARAGRERELIGALKRAAARISAEFENSDR